MLPPTGRSVCESLVAVALFGSAAASAKAAPRTMTPSADLYVAPDGNDGWSGRLPAPNRRRTDGPFATIQRARDALRSIRKAASPRNFTVLIRGGTYRLRETVVFSVADSAPPGRSITYAAFPGEAPVFTAAVPVRDWRKADPPGLPGAARGHVWVADVSDIRAMRESAAGRTANFSPTWPFRTLYRRGRRLPRARGPGFRPTNATPRGRAWDHRVLHFPRGAVHDWPDLRNAELVVVPCFFWTMNILPVESVDEKAGVLRTAAPATYPMGKNGMPDRPSAWIENVIEVLDQPGEWVLDAAAAKLYYWPEAGTPEDDIEAPLLTELFRIEGAIDYDGPTDEPVAGLRFRGLTFTGGDRLPWCGRSGWGLQHDWELFDRPTALLRFRGAVRCAVEECRFADSAHTAVRLDLTAQDNRITGNVIERMGGVGILLAGYGPGVKDVNRRNEVTNNLIHDIGEIYWNAPAIFVWQSGENRIAHNHIHHIPYTGIVVSGRISWDPTGAGECSRTVRWRELGLDPAGRRPHWSWKRREPFLHGRKNVVEYNDIHNVMEVLGDGNCIYVSGTGGGNIVRANFCHDCRGPYMNAAIRCDDDQNDTRIERNIIWRNRGFGEGVISKGDNDIINNVIADLRPDGRQRGYIVFPYGSIQGSMIQRNILYSCRKGQPLYFVGRARRRGAPGPRLQDAEIDYNLYFCTADPNWAKTHLRTSHGLGIEKHSIEADPLFRDPRHGDFRLRSGSPGVRLGIAGLDPSFCGLTSPWREKYIGRRLHCRIEPPSCELAKATTIRITCDAPDAEIRYTMDNSRPTPDSPLYTGPFLLDHPAVIRARAFRPGATDLTGAYEHYTAPPPPIHVDFEETPVGAQTPGATTVEENPRFSARVSDEHAAGGARSLKFVDGPGQEHRFNPHVFFRTRFQDGAVRGRFAIRIDENTSFLYQWRDYESGKYHRGPTIQVRPGGKVVLGRRLLLNIPFRTWVRFEVVSALGEAAAHGWTLKVIIPGNTAPTVFRNLPLERGFRSLDWVGFVADGALETQFYVDDIAIEPL